MSGPDCAVQLPDGGFLPVQGDRAGERVGDLGRALPVLVLLEAVRVGFGGSRISSVRDDLNRTRRKA